MNAFRPLIGLLLFSTLSYSQAPAQNCGCESKPLPPVIAIVNDVKITSTELDTPLQERLQQLRQHVIDARKGELDVQINSLLLDDEARRRGISSAQLLKLEVEQKVPTPTDAEAQDFYNQNKSRIGDEFPRIKQDIIEYLRDQRRREIAQAFFSRLRGTAQIKTEVPAATAPLTAADRSRVFAVVNGRNITSAEIEDSLLPLIADVQEQMYALRKNTLDVKINDLLLEREAKLKNKTSKELLAELDAKTPVVTDQDALKFFNDNKDRINGPYDKVKAQIIEYLIETEKDKQTRAFADQLRSHAQLQVFLTAPEPPVYKIATDDQPTKGNIKAAVTLIEFTDYQCPICAQQQSVLERVVTEFGDRIRFVVRDFPLSQHQQAWKAAEAAEAAREQGKYWEFVQLLYTRQSALEPEKLKQYATELGLDRAKFDAALDSGRFNEQVRRDVFDGERLGIGGTPTLFLNGQRLRDHSYESLKAAIEAALKKAA